GDQICAGAPPLSRSVGELAEGPRSHRALRDGAQQHRWSSSGPGIYAFSRLDRREQHAYVVAVHNDEQDSTAELSTYMRDTSFQLVYGSGTDLLRSDASRRLGLTVGPLSAV